MSLDDHALHAVRYPDLALPSEGLLAYVGVEQNPAAELGALDGPHSPPVGPVRGILVIMLDSHDEDPLLGVRLARRYLQDIGFARPCGRGDQQDTRQRNQPAQGPHEAIVAWG